SESEREEHHARSERERPGEHTEKRLAHEWVVNHPAEVPQADSGSPTGLQLLTARRDERAAAVVTKDHTVGDPDELVSLRVVPKRRLKLDGRIEPFRTDRAIAPGWHG